MWSAEKAEYSRSGDWGKAMDAVYKTPSGKAGGNSYKNKKGIDSGWAKRYNDSVYEDDDVNYNAAVKSAKKPQPVLTPYQSPVQKVIDQYKLAFSTDNNQTAWEARANVALDIVSIIPIGRLITLGGKGALWAGRAALGANAVAKSSKFGTLTHASSGIAPYATQRTVTAGHNGSIQAHHLIEKRFRMQMGGNTDDWSTIVVTRSDHQVSTNAWRGAIPYGAGTRNASRANIEAAARQIYADYPEILTALGLK